MAIPLERQLLEKMLEDGGLDEKDLLQLVQLPEETHYVDFKHGALLDDPKKAAATVRQYVTGFANANGGLLIIGVSDGKGDPQGRQFTNVNPPGRQALGSWADSALAPVSSGFSPFPRIQVLNIQGHDVLLIAVDRAPVLIPCNDQYWLRFGESTRAMAPYLVSDLLLGRRSHPLLELSELPGGSYSSAGEDSVRWFAFELDNVGLVPAAGIVVGMLTWAMSPVRAEHGRAAPAHLLRYIDVRGKPALDYGASLMPIHATTAKDRFALPAFAHSKVPALQVLATPGGAEVAVRSALYVVAEGHPPDWYQFDWVLPSKKSPGGGQRLHGRLIRCRFDPPIIEWGTDWRQAAAPETAGG
jgi:hypothetical protein